MGVFESSRAQSNISKAIAIAHQAEEKSSLLAQEIRILSDWMRDDVLCLAGPDLATRRELFDFIVEQLEERETLNKKIRTVRRTLKNQRDDLLAFANILEKRFSKLADLLGILESLEFERFCRN